MNKKSGRVTVYDIAKKCGVSVATVSRVINHPGEVSEDTRDCIIEAMDELGFSYFIKNIIVKIMYRIIRPCIMWMKY